MAVDETKTTVECPDGGTCHHECAASSCFRVKHAGPLSAAGYPGNSWPEAIRREHGAESTNATEVHDSDSVASIRGLKSALSALAEEVSEEETIPFDEQLASIIEYTTTLDELDHPKVLVEAISLLVQSIHSLKPELQHSSDWLLREDKQLRESSEKRWLGELN